MAEQSKTNFVQRRARLGDRQKELLLSILIRSQQAFDALKDTLEPAHFSGAYDKNYAVIWAATLDFQEEHLELPQEEHLKAEVARRLQDTPDEFDDDDASAMTALIEIAFDLQKKEINVALAKRLAVRLLEESLQRELREASEGEVVADFPALLQEKANRAHKIHALESGTLSQPFPGATLDDLRKMPGLKKYTTGMLFVDQYMNGGQAAGEVYGLCAPYGVGKTTAAVQLAAFRSKWEQDRHRIAQRRTGKKFKLPMVYLAAWEEEVESLRVRVLSYLAKVPRTLIENEEWDNLSTRDYPESLKDYERRLFSKKLAEDLPVPGEKERLERAMRVVNRNLRFVDFTGADRTMVASGAAMAQGLAQVIMSDQLVHKNPGVSMVVADHANAAAEAAIEFNGWDHDRKKRHLVGNFPRSLKANIAAPLKCPVWVMHQLDTKANAKSSGTAPKVTDSAEAKNFFEYVNFGFMLGTKNYEELCILVNGKQRRAEKKREMVIRVDGLFCTLRDTDNKYRLHEGKIVTRADFAKFADDEYEEDADAAANSVVRRYNDGIGV